MKILDGFFDFDHYDKSVWRYMSLEKFDSILESRSLYFASAEQFINEDNHEGAITEQEYENRVSNIRKYSNNEYEVKRNLKQLEKAFKPLREYAKISCWHINENENIAMWKYYQGKDRGIAIESTSRKLERFVGSYRIDKTYGEEAIHLGLIKYIDFETESMDFRHGSLTRFLYKRNPYSYENELRMIISLRMAKEFGVKTPKEGILVPFDFENAINRIVLPPDADYEMENKVHWILKKYNSKIPIEYSRLMKKPKY